MTTAVAIALIPLILLLPGYSLLGLGCPRRLRLPFVVFASVIVTSILGLALMAVGRFSVPLIAALEAPLLLIQIRSRAWPALHLRCHLLAISWFMILAAFAVLTSGEPFDATGDAGVYTISAQHLASTGRWTWSLDELIPAGVPESLVVSEPPYVRTWREVAPGFIVRGGHVMPQFFPLFPVWGAVFNGPLGMRGILAANLLGAFMLVLGCDSLFRLLLGRVWRLAGMAVLLLNPILLVFLKYPSAEVLLAGLLAGWLLWMVLFLRAPAPRSAVIPAALLALCVLTKFLAWAVAAAAIVALVLLPWRHVKAALAFVLLLLPAVALGAWLAAPHLGNHLGQLMILPGFKLTVLACASALILRFLWSSVSGAVARGLAVAYIVALVVLWFVSDRPYVRDFAELSGAAVLWGGALGQSAYLWRRRKTWLVFPAFVFSILSLYLFLGSGDSPYFPFAARRYLPITVPIGALFFGYLARWLARAVGRVVPFSRAAAAVLAAAMGALAALPPLWAQRSAVLMDQGTGFSETLAGLERAVPGDRVVLAIGQAWRYSPHLLLAGRPTFCLDMSRRGVLAEIDAFLRDHPRTLVLSAEPQHEGAVAVVDERRRAIRQDRRPPLGAGAWSTASFGLFELARRPLTVPEQIDVGSGDLLRVAGCHDPERADGRSFRWTSGNARLLVGPAGEIRFSWSRGGNPHVPLPVRVLARGRPIGQASLERGWQTSGWFSIPQASGPALIEIRTPTFQPALHGAGGDRRTLGLRLDLVEVR